MLRFALSLILTVAAFAGGVMRPSIPDTVSPVRRVAIANTFAYVRVPPGKGPFPAVIYYHGGLDQSTEERLKSLAGGDTLSRFLAAGYVVAAAEFATRTRDPQNPETLRDCLDIVKWVQRMPEVDPASVVIYGTSGGGSLVLEIAGETKVAAAIADEPASILFTGMLTRESAHGRDIVKSSDNKEEMENPRNFYTPARQKLTKEKIAKISCPVLIVRGDKHVINRINEQIIVPELKEAGKKYENILYEGQAHGFSIGNSSPEAALKFFADSQRFVLPYLKTKPKPLAESHYQQVAASSKRGEP